MATKKPERWNFYITALWGYATVMTGIFFIESLLPESSYATAHPDPLSGLFIFCPVLIFFIYVAHKQEIYIREWWKKLLLIYSLLIFLLLNLGLFLPQGSSGTGSSGSLWVSLIFLPSLYLLVLVGSYQFD